MNFSHFFVLLITLIEITLLIGIPYLLIRYIIRLNKKNRQKIHFENNLGSTGRIYPTEINDKNFEELDYLQFKQQQPQLRKNRFWRKFIFFYLVINLIAYTTFLLKFHPKIENEEKETYYSEYNKSYNKTFTTIYDYVLIPDYEILQRCSDCELKESENFYPFHKFSFAFGSGGYDSYFHNYYRNSTKGFVGIFGFYGHTEFFFYVIVPILIYLLSIIYKKYVR
jgi:hypothetical protein